MRFRSLIACAAAPMVVAATEPVRLQPSSQWILDYAENSCRLIRSFGEGKTKTVLLFESAAPRRMDILVEGKPLENLAETVGVRFLPAGGEPLKGRVAETEQKEPAILWSNVYLLPSDTVEKLEQEQKDRLSKPTVRPPPQNSAVQAVYKSQRRQFVEGVTELEIQTRRNHPVILVTGSLGTPISMLDQCAEDSLKDWGVDPAIESKIVRPVWAPNSMLWFRSDDYPQDLLKRGEESIVTVRLLVDATGKVTKCTSLSPFNEPEFNRITCNDILKRAHFEPAELADGTKVPSYYENRVIFQIAH